MENAQVFVTGGTGFLGGVLLATLLREGYRVRMLARHLLDQASPPGIEKVQGDLSDVRRLTEQMTGCSAVFHTAALVATWRKDEQEYYKVNLEGFRNVLEASEKAGVDRLIYTSTFFALGPHAPPGAVEDSGLDDIKRHPYQHSKLLARKEARRVLTQGRRMVILYPGVIYGPGRRTEGNIVVRLISDFLAGKVPGLLGDGRQTWSYAFVEDVARGHLLALRQSAGSGEYVLGGENVSFGEFFGLLGKLVGKPAPRLKIPPAVGTIMGALEVAWAHVSGRMPRMTPSTVSMMSESWACDSTKAYRQLGYTCRPLQEGLIRTLEWMGIQPTRG